MNSKMYFLKARQIKFALGVALLGALTGCAGYVEGPRAAVYAEPPLFVVEDDYVYYPNYQCYYSVSRHQYAYREGRYWVSRAAPRGVTVNVLMASPSVRMEFHDSPAQHHATVVKQYPKNWKPSGANQNQKERRKEDRGGNKNGR